MKTATLMTRIRPRFRSSKMMRIRLIMIWRSRLICNAQRNTMNGISRFPNTGERTKTVIKEEQSTCRYICCYAGAPTYRHVEVETRSDDVCQIEHTLNSDDNASTKLDPYHPDVCALPRISRSLRLLNPDYHRQYRKHHSHTKDHRCDDQTPHRGGLHLERARIDERAKRP